MLALFPLPRQNRKHSFDLIHFPIYVSRKVPPRVRIKIIDDHHSDFDLMGWFKDDQHSRSWKYASLIADDDGCPTDSDDFYCMEADVAQAIGMCAKRSVNPLHGMVRRAHVKEGQVRR